MATNELEADCSPEAVFAVLADGWLYPTWVVGASRMRDVDDRWPEPGSRLHHSVGVWPALLDDITESLEWQPPRRAVFKARGWPLGSARVEMEVEPRVDGCLIRITENVQAGPGLLILKPIRDGMIYLRNTETLNRLRYLAEGGAGADNAWPSGS